MPRRKRKPSAGDASPALIEYRFTVPHTHGDRAYRVGDIVEIDEATADRIRRYAGVDALQAVRDLLRE